MVEARKNRLGVSGLEEKARRYRTADEENKVWIKRKKIGYSVLSHRFRDFCAENINAATFAPRLMRRATFAPHYYY